MNRIDLYNRINKGKPRSCKDINVWIEGAWFGGDTCAVFFEYDYGFNLKLCSLGSYTSCYKGDELKNCIYYRYLKDYNALCFSIPSDINGSLIIDIGSLISVVASDVIRRYNLSKLIIDMKDADMSNIIEADSMFSGIDYNTSISLIMPKGSKALKPVSVTRMFSGTNIININSVLRDIDFSYVAYAYRMFEHTPVTSVDLSKANLSNLVSAHSMFNASYIHRVKLPISGMNKVQDVEKMFNWCSKLEEVDISCFKYNSIRKANGMFSNCSMLKKVEANWEKMFKLAYVENMFAYDDKLEDIDITGFMHGISSSVAMTNLKDNVSISGVFTGCTEFRWAREYTPIHMYGKYNYGAVCYMLGCIDCKLLDISDISVNGVSPLYLKYRKYYSEDGIDYLPDILITDYNQYVTEEKEYNELKGSGLNILSIGRNENIDDIVKKIKLFQTDGAKYVIVLGSVGND